MKLCDQILLPIRDHLRGRAWQFQIDNYRWPKRVTMHPRVRDDLLMCCEPYDVEWTPKGWKIFGILVVEDARVPGIEMLLE
jgi:hypothetical protein